MKPEFEIFAWDAAPSCLEAHDPLTRIPSIEGFHTQRHFRPPLGIYNVSVSRISERLERLCRHLRLHFEDTREDVADIQSDVIAYIELAIYAAAEHVDDIDSIADGFYPNSAAKKRSSAYLALQKDLRRHKKLLASAANAIKHQQARIRTYSVQYRHGDQFGQLLGFYIEGVRNRQIGPSSIFHQNQMVFSMTTIVWEIITFLLDTSRTLAKFLANVSPLVEGPTRQNSVAFQNAVLAACQLPLYSLGEDHPFQRYTLKISVPPDSLPIAGNLYGSMSWGWIDDASFQTGRHKASYEGDGVSTKFTLIHPREIKLLHWT